MAITSFLFSEVFLGPHFISLLNIFVENPNLLPRDSVKLQSSQRMGVDTYNHVHQKEGSTQIWCPKWQENWSKRVIVIVKPPPKGVITSFFKCLEVTNVQSVKI